MRKIRLRFGLRSAFVTATLFILAVGLTQARRRSILKEADALRASGANFAIDQHWWEKIWLITPSEAGIRFQLRPDGRMVFASEVGSRKEAVVYAKSLQKRLNEFGVEKVHFFVEMFSNGTAYLEVTPTAQGLANMTN